jgi:hypothetical protein
MQNQNVKAISEYLEAICNKLNKEFTSEQQQNQSMQSRSLNQVNQTPQLNNQDVQQNSQTNIDNTDNIESAENDNSQLGNDDESVQINDDQVGNVSNQNPAMNVDSDLGKINGGEKSTDSQMELPIEKKRKIDPDLINIEKKTTKDDFDSELIKLISENTYTVTEWKEMAVNLKMDEDTISFIESEPNEVKEQTKKILQLWKVNLRKCF